MKQLLSNILLILLAGACWSVALSALITSDGKCKGICENCVYSGNCPQEKKEEEVVQLILIIIIIIVVIDSLVAIVEF